MERFGKTTVATTDAGLYRTLEWPRPLVNELSLNLTLLEIDRVLERQSTLWRVQESRSTGSNSIGGNPAYVDNPPPGLSELLEQILCQRAHRRAHREAYRETTEKPQSREPTERPWMPTPLYIQRPTEPTERPQRAH